MSTGVHSILAPHFNPLCPYVHIPSIDPIKKFERNTDFSMARNQPKKYRHFISAKPSGSASASNSRPSQALARDAASIAGTSGRITGFFHKAFAKTRRIFRRSNQGHVTAETFDTEVRGGAQGQQEPIQGSPTQDPLETFHSVVATIAKVHPYTQIALGILTAAAQSLTNQSNLDHDLSDLIGAVRAVYVFLLEDNSIQNIESMREVLRRIVQVTSDAAWFIKNYSETKELWKQQSKNIVFETWVRTDGYTKLLNSLVQQYQDCVFRDVHTNIYHVLEDLNPVRGELDLVRGDLGELSLEGMVYAGGASVNKTRTCLDGTRAEILSEIIT